MIKVAERYYWLKLKRDFFKRHDIRIIEEMPNGKDYILFYLKLLCESIDHNGNLRFSEQIPYNAEMLATITNTNVDIVKSAINIFAGLHMLEIMDDGTFYMAEVERLMGCETKWAEKKRLYRNGQKAIEGQIEDNLRTKKDNVRQEKDKEKDKDIDIKENKKRKVAFCPPTIEEVKVYCQERKNNINPEQFVAYYSSNGWMVGRNKMKSWKQAIITWECRNKSDVASVKQANNYDQRQYSDDYLNSLYKDVNENE